MNEPEPQSACIEGVAVVSGSAAWWIAKLLTRHCRDDLADLPPKVRAPLEDAIENLRLAGERCAISARGNQTGHSAEVAVSSNHDDELDSAAAAAMLGLSARRVRQLAKAGLLPGRLKAGRCWSFDTDAVSAYRKTGGTQ
jgi:hypothetical protein